MSKKDNGGKGDRCGDCAHCHNINTVTGTGICRGGIPQVVVIPKIKKISADGFPAIDYMPQAMSPPVMLIHPACGVFKPRKDKKK